MILTRCSLSVKLIELPLSLPRFLFTHLSDPRSVHRYLVRCNGRGPGEGRVSGPEGHRPQPERRFRIHSSGESDWGRGLSGVVVTNTCAWTCAELRHTPQNKVLHIAAVALRLSWIRSETLPRACGIAEAVESSSSSRPGCFDVPGLPLPHEHRKGVTERSHSSKRANGLCVDCWTSVFSE